MYSVIVGNSIIRRKWPRNRLLESRTRARRILHLLYSWTKKRCASSTGLKPKGILTRGLKSDLLLLLNCV
ncbi:unnamed protein product [Amoebophrya sp. A25]|nr:unnamed protein product [Amoebophrya sp. A25]|eukprot:GSA25T00017212001.1